MLINTAYTIFNNAVIYNLTTLCLNGTLPCVDFMDVIMGDIPRIDTYSARPNEVKYFHTIFLGVILFCNYTVETIQNSKQISLTTLNLPLYHTHNYGNLNIKLKVIYSINVPQITPPTLCLSVTLPCADFMDFTMGSVQNSALHLPVDLPPRAGLPVSGISPMITSMKSTHESVPLKHNVIRLYIELYAKYSIAGVSMGCSGQWNFIPEKGPPKKPPPKPSSVKTPMTSKIQARSDFIPK